MKTGLEKNFDDIELSDIQALVSQSIPEDGYTLEYKRALNLDEKLEFLKDLSSLANFNGGNTIGGDIIYGIAEEKGKGTAKEITPISCDNVDALKQRINSILQDGIKPHITYKLKEINVDNNQILLFFRVRKSLDALHAVHNECYARNSSGKYLMDATEVKNAQKFFEKFNAFKAERINKIINGDTPVKISPKGNIVLHFIPASAFLSDKEIDMQTLANKSDKLGMLFLKDWDCKSNPNGYLLYSPENNGIRYDYTQIYGNGIIEVVDGQMLDPDPIRYPYFVKCILSPCLVESTLDFFNKALSFYQSIGIKPPIRFQMSLVNIKGYGLVVSEELQIRHYLSLGKNPPVATENNIILPERGERDECVIYDFSDKPESVLMPLFNKLWQHFGYPKCDIQIRNGVIVNV